MLTIKPSELWRYADCEFVADVGGHPMRVILKTTDSKNAIVSNYYHRSNTYKIKLKSFIETFKLVEETTSDV